MKNCCHLESGPFGPLHPHLIPGSSVCMRDWKACFRKVPSMVPPGECFQCNQAKNHVWNRHHNSFHSWILNGWVASWITSRWIISWTVGTAAHLLAMIGSTAIFHPSGYQSAQLSDIEIFWPHDCFTAFGGGLGVLHRSMILLMWSMLHGSSVHTELYLTGKEIFHHQADLVLGLEG